MGDGLFKIVFCCRANECRSPAAVTLFRSKVSEELLSTLLLDDAGTRPSSATAMCADALAWITSEGPAGILLESHVSTPVNVATLANADLVLAMDDQVRSAVLREAVGHHRTLRQRLFTMVEAAKLADAVRTSLAGTASQELALRLDPLPTGTEERLTWLVSEMDAARGLVGVPKQRRFRSAAPQEITDVHDPGNRVKHKTMLPQLDSAVGSLATALQAVVDAEDEPAEDEPQRGTGGPGGGRQVITGLKR